MDPQENRTLRRAQTYAHERGLTWQYLRAAGCSLTHVQQRPAIEIPTASGPRWRFLDGAIPRDKQRRGVQ